MKNYKNGIIHVLSLSKHPMETKKIIKRLKVKRHELYIFNEAMNELIKNNKIEKSEKGFILSKSKKSLQGTVLKIHDKFGFVKLEETGEEIFVPGKYLMGAMPGDSVNIAVSKGNGNLSEGKILTINDRTPYRFSGNIVKSEGKLKVTADRDFKLPIDIKRSDLSKVKEGDKVTAEICKYGDSHFTHLAKIIKVFGSSQMAKNCCEAVLEANSVPRIFPDEVIAQAKEIEEKGIHPKEILQRKDLRDEIIFTMDGADTKDIDDAVSLKKLPDGWELGVHIADVSYYVYQGCPLDKEAFKRGNSVYFADSVIPMLPKELSNGICSLNPNEDRLAFSCTIKLNKNGDMDDYSFDKTIIRSRVKGVYSEINQILEGSESEEIKEKYKDVRDMLFLMQELADILNKKRMGRGSSNFKSSECKIILDENGKAIDIKPRVSGISENIIEEFMLTANEAAATFALKENIPFVYRIHEPPSPERLSQLKELLGVLGINTSEIKEGCGCIALSHVLEKVRGTKYEVLVNNNILRTMSKAKYSENNVGHYGLVLENYAHFTSPIRRYSDLTIHRIMSGLLTGMRRDNIEKKFRDFAAMSAKQTTATEMKAVNVERDCEDCYKAEYMTDHIGEEFDGIISSVTPQGVYVELPNTVEGLCRLQYIENSDYVMENDICYKDYISGKTLTVGDNVRIKVIKADVALGNIDFEIVEKI